MNNRVRLHSKYLKIKRSKSDVIVLSIVTIIMLFFLIAFTFPVVQVIISSFFVKNSSSPIGITFSLDGYAAILNNPMVLRAFLNSVVYTTVGTAFSIVVTILTAYVISRPDFRLARYVTLMFIFTNYFSGGFIPTYLLVKSLGLLNSMWSLILPSAVSVYNVLLLESYFRNHVPMEMYDAARIDGCGHWRYLLKIVLPLSSSFIAILAFFYAVSYWNSYFNASIYITDMDKLPLPNILKEMLISNRELMLTLGGNLTDSGITVVQQSMLFEYALIVFASVPMIVLLLIVRKASKNYDSSGGIVI